jgi:aryl-alcohol dehydrogenase-like predicted oxidoreductase
MEYKNLSNIKISKIGMGTWGISGDWGIKFTEDYILDLFSHAFNRGINYFDTAPVYGNGLIETIIGKFKNRNKLIISTKIPAIKKPDLSSQSSIKDFYQKDYIDKILYSSLKRLNRECIDLLMLHNWHPDWNKDCFEIIEYLNSLKEEKRVRAIGISLPNYMNQGFDDIDGLELIDFFMIPLNLIQQWPIDYIKNVKTKKEIFIIARSVFEQGLLIEDFKKIDKNKECFLKEKNGKKIRETIKQRDDFYKTINIDNRAAYCMNFCFTYGADIVMLGMNSKGEIDENINNLNNKFDKNNFVVARKNYLSKK